MRFIASAFERDSRPERPEGWDKMSSDEKKEAKKKHKAKDGFRTGSGVRKLGEKLNFDAKSFDAAAQEVVKVLAQIPAKQQESIVRVVISVDESDPSSGGNPWAK